MRIALTLLFLALAAAAQAHPRSLRQAGAAAAPAPAPAEPLAPAPSPAGMVDVEAGMVDVEADVVQVEAVLPAEGAAIVLTAEEVAKHNTAEDCWYIYEGNVVDVTSYMAEDLHPDGNEVILPFCGKDATEEFNRQHRGSRAQEEQAAYIIGPLVV